MSPRPAGGRRCTARTIAVIGGLVWITVACVLAAGASEPDLGDFAVESVGRDSTVAATGDTCVVRVHVYYFHRTIRCQICRNFEAYSLEALSADFADELSDGGVSWSVLNMDDESSAPLVDAYDVFESSLVVSVEEDGEERDWEKLEAIWGMVHDKSAFMQYVSAEVDSALRERAKEKSDDGEGSFPVHGELVP